MTNTTNQIKEKITDDMVSAAEAVFLTMVYEDSVRPIVEGYKRKILAEERYHVAEEWHERRGVDFAEEITDPKHSWLMEDNDFQHYLRRCREEQAKAGLKTKSPDHCPLLVAENTTIVAEHVLIEAMEPLTGLTSKMIFSAPNALDNFHKYINLCLRLLAPFCKNRYMESIKEPVS